MKILIVCSLNSGFISPFVEEQAESLERLGVVVDYYPIRGKGVWGYLKNLYPLKKKINVYSPDLIHAHYGLTGLLASLQMKIPVVTTFHGSDINQKGINLIFSFFALALSKKSIFVHSTKFNKLKKKQHSFLIPCGVDLTTFYTIDKGEARMQSGLKREEIYGLFSSNFSNKVKNYQLAKKALKHLNKKIHLIELVGYNRDEVNILLNAVDFLLMTSISEGSPQIIKEAMACNCPIITTDVGDVRKIIGPTKDCFITSFDSNEIGDKIRIILASGLRSNGRLFMESYGLDKIAMKVKDVYESI